MAKKKTLGKKHKFKHVEAQSSVSQPDTEMTAQSTSAPKAAVSKLRSAASGVVSTRDFSYVSSDLKRIGIMAISLMALELILWYTFSHTGLGNSVYSLVKI